MWGAFGFVFIDLRGVILSQIKDGGLAFSVRMLNVKSMFFFTPCQISTNQVGEVIPENINADCVFSEQCLEV